MDSSQSHHVLCVPREDDAEQFVLLNVINRGDRDNIELFIEGTEGELPYVGEFSNSELLSCAASGIKASEWGSAVIASLLQDNDTPGYSPNLTVTASLATASPTKSSKGSLPATLMHLAIRGSPGAEPMGSITLRSDPSHEIDTLAWTATAVRRGNTTARDAGEAKLDASVARADAHQLSKDLAAAQQQHKEAEDKILRGFLAVLNAKKAKIRQLERAVAALRAGNGSSTMTEVKTEDGGKDSDVAVNRSKAARAAEASRKGKRKASQEGTATAAAAGSTLRNNDGESDVQSSDGSESGFESMRRLAMDSDSNDADDAENGTDSAEDERPAVPRRGIGKLGGITGKADKTANETKKKTGIGKIGGNKAKGTASITPPSKNTGKKDTGQKEDDKGTAPQKTNQNAAQKKSDSGGSSTQAAGQRETRQQSKRHSQTSGSESDAFEKAEPVPLRSQKSKSASVDLPPVRKLPFEDRGHQQPASGGKDDSGADDESTTSDDEL